MALGNVIAAFEASHPSIHVDYQPSCNYVLDVETAFASGHPPAAQLAVLVSRSHS